MSQVTLDHLPYLRGAEFLICKMQLIMVLRGGLLIKLKVLRARSGIKYHRINTVPRAFFKIKALLSSHSHIIVIYPFKMYSAVTFHIVKDVQTASPSILGFLLFFCLFVFCFFF